MDHGECPVVSSKPSDPQQRRPDGRMYFVEAAEQLGSDDWQISDAVDWQHERLGCSSRPGTLVPCFEGTGGPSPPAWTSHAQGYCTSGWLTYLSTNSERKVDWAAEFFISRWCRPLVLNTAKVNYHLFKYVIDVLIDYFRRNKPHGSVE